MMVTYVDCSVVRIKIVWLLRGIHPYFWRVIFTLVDFVDSFEKKGKMSGRMRLKLRPEVRITFMENFIMSG